MAINVPRKLWTIEEYELLIEKGVLNENHRVELIRGEILEMAAIGPRHATCVRRLEEWFHDSLRKAVIISGQNPIRLPNDSEPEPDVALLRRRADEYSIAHPRAEDVVLLVEVSDSTLGADRSAKVPLYAEAGVQNMWLVNLDKDVVEVYSQPVGGQYEQLSLIGRGEMLSLPGGLPGEISVDELLG